MLCLIDMPIQTLIPPNRLSFHSFSEMFTSFPFLPALDSIILHRWTWKRMLTLIKYFILDPFFSGPMTSNFLRSWNQLIITQTQEEGSLSYPCKCLHTAIKCNNVCTDMSFCRGSVNCHGSDGQMYHFCDSSRSGEICLDQYRGGGGVGVFIPCDKFIRIGLFRSVNRPSVASESWPTPVTHWNFNTSGWRAHPVVIQS